MPNQYTGRSDPESRFWPKVDRHGPLPDPTIYPGLGRCWIWTGAKRPTGYGVFWFTERQRGAHVAAYVLTYGEPPSESPYITHLCDGAAIGCVRPSHLKADTQAGNLRGMVERGRALTGGRNPMARVTEDQVREIRLRKAAGESYSALERAFGMTRCPLWKIVHRVSWSHVS